VEPIKSLLTSKASHRFLAMLRGKTLKIVKIRIEVNQAEALKVVETRVVSNFSGSGCPAVLNTCVETAYKKHLHSSVSNEFITEMRAIAEEAAISVFGTNLEHLLLAPYLGSKTVMGIDPGVRTGCKVVVVDTTGKLLFDHVIYLHEEGNKAEQAKVILNKTIETLKIEHIAIGNGTFGRETLAFVEENVPSVQSAAVKATLVSEAGASVYSASDAAIEEFPNKDITVRGAVSIARRFQDPLSELVKIDPKSIGVGQYQHDVNQKKLQQSLEGVVEHCVNYVGVDLNTASYHLLQFISGIGPTLSKNVIAFRNKEGRFKNRQELLKVGRFTEKVFQQAAGFLRIYDGDNPFDSTFVHPERFAEINSWCAAHSVEAKDLLNKKEIVAQFAADTDLETKFGEHTFKDIVASLNSPSQDPRTSFKSTNFSKGLKSLADVKVGSVYVGVVNNITNFGAFVDIGIKETGLVHISQLADKFVEDPFKVVKVGQEVKVRVLEIDPERKRLALSCKSDTRRPQPPQKKNPKKATRMSTNRPFAALKNFKIK